MFGFKTMYKQGMIDALRANEAFSQKQEAAIAYMRDEVRNGSKKIEQALNDAVNSLEGNINGLYQYLDSRELAALYRLNTPLDLRDLEKEEQQLLLSVLIHLANEGAESTEAQKRYIRSLQSYLGITNPQTEQDLSVVENIDSLRVQKAFLRAILEFLYLQDGQEFTDAQAALLERFSIKESQAQMIHEQVGRLYRAVGPEGIAQKYGYVTDASLSDEPDWRDAQKQEVLSVINQIGERETNIMLVGATGCGKSSTINALFSTAVAQIGSGPNPVTEGIAAYSHPEIRNFQIWDTPGFGRSPDRDKQLTSDIKEMLGYRKPNGYYLIDRIVVIFNAAAKEVGPSCDMINTIIKCVGADRAKKCIIAAMNQVDLLMGGNHWDSKTAEPDEILTVRIEERVALYNRRMKEQTGLDLIPVYYASGYVDEETGEQEKPYFLRQLVSKVIEGLE